MITDLHLHPPLNGLDFWVLKGWGIQLGNCIQSLSLSFKCDFNNETLGLFMVILGHSWPHLNSLLPNSCLWKFTTETQQWLLWCKWVFLNGADQLAQRQEHHGLPVTVIRPREHGLSKRERTKDLKKKKKRMWISVRSYIRPIHPQ